MPKAGAKVPSRSYGQVIEFQLSEELKKLHKPRKHFAYQIEVTWSDSAVRRVYRSYDQIFDCYTALSAIMKDGGMVKLAGKKTFERSTTQNFAVKHFPAVKMFIDSLLNLPTFMLQSDLFLWFWEPNTEDVRLCDIDRTVENNAKYPLASKSITRGGTVIIEDDEHDYICVCTALSYFDANMPPQYADLKGLQIKEGDVIYVLRMSGCPPGYWKVRNVFGSEGHVPIANLRVDQDILQRKKRRSARVQQQRLEMIKSAENISERQAYSRDRRSCSVVDLRGGKRGEQNAGMFSPPMSRTLRDLNNSMANFIEPQQSSYRHDRHHRRSAGRTAAYHPPAAAYHPPAAAAYHPQPTAAYPPAAAYHPQDSLTSRRQGGFEERQVTHELIRSLHETSLMLQERMAMSEIETHRKRLFDEQFAASHPSRPRQSFVRSPTKRGPRVSARFKRMSPSTFVSPCRKGIKNLRVQAPSPLATDGISPSQSLTFTKSPGAGLKRAVTADSTLEASPTKKSCTIGSGNDSGHMSQDDQVVKKAQPRRRSDIARRVSMRLKQVYGRSPKSRPAKSPKSRTPKKRVAGSAEGSAE